MTPAGSPVIQLEYLPGEHQVPQGTAQTCSIAPTPTRDASHKSRLPPALLTDRS